MLFVPSLLIPIAVPQSRPESWAESRFQSANQNSIPAEDRIDINHASLEQLLKIHGMTRSWAARIVRYRPYHTKQDLADRGIVNGTVYDRIKDAIIAHKNSE